MEQHKRQSKASWLKTLQSISTSSLTLLFSPPLLRVVLDVLLFVMEVRREMLAVLNQTPPEQAQTFHEKSSPLKCSSVELLGFANSFVTMLEDEFQAKVYLRFIYLLLDSASLTGSLVDQ